MKKYPIYDDNELYRASRAGAPNIILDFADFINELNDSDLIESLTEKGIIELVNAKGTKCLTIKQGYVLNHIVGRYENRKCIICSLKIPLDEAIYIKDGLCSYHMYSNEKD